MISDERVSDLSNDDYVGSILGQEITAMAKELLAYRQAFSEPVCCIRNDEIECMRADDWIQAFHPSQFDSLDAMLYRKPTIPE